MLYLFVVIIFVEQIYLALLVILLQHLHITIPTYTYMELFSSVVLSNTLQGTLTQSHKQTVSRTSLRVARLSNRFNKIIPCQRQRSKETLLIHERKHPLIAEHAEHYLNRLRPRIICSLKAESLENYSTAYPRAPYSIDFLTPFSYRVMII